MVSNLSTDWEHAGGVFANYKVSSRSVALDVSWVWTVDSCKFTKHVCVDKDKKRITELNKGKCPFYEPGLENLLTKHLNDTKHLSFSTSLKEAMNDADIVFITVGTPSRRLEDEADLSAVYDVAKEIAENIYNYCLVVTKSTVPVGTTNEVNKIISSKVHKDNFNVVLWWILTILMWLYWCFR